MSGASIRSASGDVLYLCGEVVIASAPALLAEARSLFAERERIIFDLAEVTRVDSSGLALMLEWLQLAHARNIPLQFRNIPTSLLRIARLSNVEGLLPLASG
jgi:phospholipid transport system transporter-binding protein